MLKILKYAEDKGKEQGIEEGKIIGIEKGRIEGIEQGIEKGRIEGIERGIEKGRIEGIEEGRIEEKRNMIERMLVKKFCPLSIDVVQKIQHMDNIMLDILSFEILDFQSIDDFHSFMKKMNL